MTSFSKKMMNKFKKFSRQDAKNAKEYKKILPI